MAPRYYKANAATDNSRPAKYRTRKGQNSVRRQSRLPVGTDLGLCDKVQDDKSCPSQVSVCTDPGLLGRWRRWWRKSRRSEASLKKEREEESEGEGEGWRAEGWGGEGKEERTSYF